MTERERLHLVEKMGVFMRAVEPEGKKDQRDHGVTINVNSPDNCVVAGDRIEININVNNAHPDPETRTRQGASLLSVERLPELQSVVRDVLDACLPRRPDCPAPRIQA
jgi:hypothetical protein